MTPTEVSAMTLDEVRDLLAEMDGYKREPAFRDDVTGVVLPERWYKNGRWHPDNHPYQPTLDGADAAMPKGYYWERAMGAWNAYPSSVAPNEIAEPFVVVPDTGDKIRDLFTLAVLCRIAGKGEGK